LVRQVSDLFADAQYRPAQSKTPAARMSDDGGAGPGGTELRDWDRVGVEIALNAIELFAKQRYLLRGDSGQCYPVHFHRVGQHHIPQPFSLGRETDVDLAAIL
jgi:hypothetical protein